MTTLLAFLGEQTAHVQKLIDAEQWEKVILVTHEKSQHAITCAKPVKHILIDENAPVSQIIETITKGLQNERGEVALNFVSGSGKEHMALLAAVMHTGLAFRLVAVTKDGIKEL